MKSCVVLGNGPSLLTGDLPAGADRIGVNLSWPLYYAETWCTVDYDCFKRDIPLFESGRVRRPERAFVRSSAVGRPNTPPIPPWVSVTEKFKGNSGLFAMNKAMSLRYERIYLLGFDPWTVDKWYGKGVKGIEWAREWARMALFKRRRDPRLWRWSGSTYRPLAETLDWDAKGKKL